MEQLQDVLALHLFVSVSLMCQQNKTLEICVSGEGTGSCQELSVAFVSSATPSLTVPRKCFVVGDLHSVQTANQRRWKMFTELKSVELEH